MSVLYFAYGSNMESRQMKVRCPDHKIRGVAQLANYTLAFTRWSRSWNSGTADILPQRGAIVHGVVYELSLEDLKRLDKFANYPQAYIRQDVVVEVGGARLPVLTYIAVRNGVFLPSKKYLDQMTEGACEHSLPEGYVECLRKIKTHD